MEDMQSNILTQLEHNYVENNKLILNHINNVICDCSNLLSYYESKKTTAYKNFIGIGLVEWQSIYLKDIEKHKLDGHLFNVFSLWNRLAKIHEPIHSRLLSFLLSKDSLHGHGDTFLHLFLDQLNITGPKQGIWHVFPEHGGADILIKRSYPKSVVIIENKSNWASDQQNQLYRYWYRHIYQQTKQVSSCYYKEHSNEFSIIYLPPNEYKTPDNQTLSKPPKEWLGNLSIEEYARLPDKVPMEIKILTFSSDIPRWLEECIKITHITNTPLREYIRQYQEYCKTL